MRREFDPVALLISYHAAITALDFERIESLFAENVIYVSGGVGGVISGRTAVLAAFRKYFEAYPDQVSRDTSVGLVADNAARSVWELKATHSRTGEKLIRNGEETVTFDAGGRIVRVEVTDY